MYNSLRPDWFYSYLEIPNLEKITEEMMQFHTSEIVSFATHNPFYRNVFRQHMDESICPHTIEFLKSMKIYDKFERLLLSNGKTTAQAVHVDTYDPTRCQMSLNIPLEYCEGSYTAFYKSERTVYNIGVPDNVEKARSNFAWLNLKEVKEVARVELVRPMVVNTTVLHRGIHENPKRAICCFRFTPNLTYEDLQRLGIARPFEQVD